MIKLTTTPSYPTIIHFKRYKLQVSHSADRIAGAVRRHCLPWFRIAGPGGHHREPPVLRANQAQTHSGPKGNPWHSILRLLLCMYNVEQIGIVVWCVWALIYMCDYQLLQTCNYSRCGRTDKGVSALGQVAETHDAPLLYAD